MIHYMDIFNYAILKPCSSGRLGNHLFLSPDELISTNNLLISEWKENDGNYSFFLLKS